MLALAVVLGLVIGSFLNVVIARLPEHRGLWGRSACPGCRALIAWYDNVPVLSFVLLRRRCRACGMRISWRYPLIELATAALFALGYTTFGLTPELGIALGLGAGLIVITAIDLAHQIIPDAITLPGTVAGLLVNLASGRLHFLDSALGIVVGGGIFWLILEGSILLTGREGMGGGDVKLGAMLGSFLGWKIALLSIFVAVISGGVLAIALLALGLAGRRQPIPFGPFLAAGGVVGLFWGEWLLAWYLSGFSV